MNEIPAVTESRVLYTGRVFNVRTDELRYTDGTTHIVDIVEHRGSYAIIPTTADDRIVLVQQYRHPARRVLWEIPAGTSELGENAIEGALRELREETGYLADNIRPLGSMIMTPGFCDEMLHFFHASGLSEGEQELDDDERITVGSFTLEEAQRLVASGQILDAKTIIALYWMCGKRGEIAPGNSR